LILAVILAATGCPPQAEPAPADFYRGKNIDFVTAGAAGTFNDLSARIIGAHLGEDTGANVVVTNRGGASGLEATNHVYKAEPDGLTMGTVASGKFLTNKAMGEAAAQYEFDKFSYIMTIDCQPCCFFVAPEGPYQSVADLQAGQDLKIGARSPSGPMSLGGVAIIKFLGLDAKVITGFKTISELPLAVERGEITGYCLSISNATAGVKSGMVKPLFLLSTERSPLVPDVPVISELVDLSDEDLALVQMCGTAFDASNLLVTSPGIPEDRLAFLRDLANQWVQDETFREEINLVADYEVQNYLIGYEVAQLILDKVAAMDQFQAIFADLIEQYRA